MQPKKANTFFSGAQVAGGAAMAFVHGAQDGQKFLGVLLLGLFLVNDMDDTSGAVIPVWMMLLCSIVMGVGTSIGGKKIIKSVGMDMVKLEKYQASPRMWQRPCAFSFPQFSVFRSARPM